MASRKSTENLWERVKLFRDYKIGAAILEYNNKLFI